MSVQKQVPIDEALRGLHLTRKVGEIIRVRHGKSGEEFLIQINKLMSGYQVTLTFNDDKRLFEIRRFESAAQ